MSYTLVQDGDTLQVRASIQTSDEMAALIERLEKHRVELSAKEAASMSSLERGE